MNPSYIKELCAKHFSVSIEDIEGHCRKRKIVKARQAAMFLMKRFTNNSFEYIGSLFSGREHTTVIWSIKVVKNSIDCKDDYLYNDIPVLEELVK